MHVAKKLILNKTWYSLSKFQASFSLCQVISLLATDSHTWCDLLAIRHSLPSWLWTSWGLVLVGSMLTSYLHNGISYIGKMTSLRVYCLMRRQCTLYNTTSFHSHFILHHVACGARPCAGWNLKLLALCCLALNQISDSFWGCVGWR